MKKAVLNAISGVDLYAILSLGLFMTFFIGVVIWACSLRRTHIQHMRNLPLEHNEDGKGDPCHVN